MIAALLNPATLELIVAGIQAAITATPKVYAVAAAAVEWIQSLFAAGVITSETQDKLLAWVDNAVHAHVIGETPPAWTVEPDPVTPTPNQ